MKNIWYKYKEVIAYLFWGILTTAVDIIVAFTCATAFPKISVFWNTLIAWVLSVLFAFFTNRKWVFKSQARTTRDFYNELISFSFGRMASLFLEEIVLSIGIFIFGNSRFKLMKIIGQVIVILFNYFWSKMIVFVNHDSKEK
jgi:putative flippase GtrA